jgi:hypothetical protein
MDPGGINQGNADITRLSHEEWDFRASEQHPIRSISFQAFDHGQEPFAGLVAKVLDDELFHVRVMNVDPLLR